MLAVSRAKSQNDNITSHLLQPNLPNSRNLAWSTIILKEVDSNFLVDQDNEVAKSTKLVIAATPGINCDVLDLDPLTLVGGSRFPYTPSKRTFRVIKSKFTACI